MDFAKKRFKKKIPKKNSGSALFFKGFLICFFLLIGFFVYSLTSEVSGRTNIVLVGDVISLLSLENEKNTLTIVNLPKEAYIDSVFGKGKVKSSSLFKFDQVAKLKGQLFIKSMREFIGVPIDGFLVIESGKNPTNLDEFAALKNTQLSFFNIKPLFSEILKTNTNLSPLKLRRFFLQIDKVRPDKVNFTDFAGTAVFQKSLLPDGSEVLTTDNLTIDGFLNEKLFEWKILQEGLTISVLNGGDKAGLANRVSRIIANIGGHVIIVGDSPTKIDSCILHTVESHKDSYTVFRLSRIFSCKVETNNIDQNRVDVTITVGSDYQKELFGKN